MVGKLLQQARLDAAMIATSGEFATDIVLTTKAGLTPVKTINTRGLASGRWLNFDNDGNTVNSTKNHIALPEQALVTAEYPTRNAVSGKVDLVDHVVSVADNLGNAKSYLIAEVHPNETTGLIICILGKAMS